jgi:hypothetical protein
MATVLHPSATTTPAGLFPSSRGSSPPAVPAAAVVRPTTPTVPPGSTVCRVPGELSWDQLLDLILTADQTFSW